MTPKTANHHNIGDSVEWTSPGTQWSSCDTQRCVSGIHADHNVETRENDLVSTINPQKLFPKSSSSQRVTGVDTLEESDKNNALD